MKMLQLPFYQISLIQACILDRFLFAAEKIVTETLPYSSDKELWVGETSSCYDGGTPELSNSYVAGFM